MLLKAGGNDSLIYFGPQDFDSLMSFVDENTNRIPPPEKVTIIQRKWIYNQIMYINSYRFLLSLET